MLIGTDGSGSARDLTVRIQSFDGFSPTRSLTRRMSSESVARMPEHLRDFTYGERGLGHYLQEIVFIKIGLSASQRPHPLQGRIVNTDLLHVDIERRQRS